MNEATRGPTATDIFPLVVRSMSVLAVGRRADLDDLVQTASEQALLGLDRFEGRAQLSTWIYRLCYLTLLKHERWHRRWLRRFLLTDDGQLPERRVEAPSTDESLEVAERASRLRAAIAALSPKQSATVILHDLERLPIAEIAVIVGANERTVRSRLRDGRRELARRLADDPYFGDEACAHEEAEP